MQNNLSLSIDIGGTSAKYAYVTADGRLTGKNSFSTAGLKNLDEFYPVSYTHLDVYKRQVQTCA